MKNKFKFFAPVDDFQKSKNNKGDEVWKVRGIISDATWDADGESLSEEGLDFSEFNWINWDHKKEPKYLIGEPIGVKHIPGQGHFMEGELYPDSDIARQAVDLMKVLSKSKKKNKLSWSVEGQVLERDLINPKKVKKAKITAVALCPTPKNGNTWAELVHKGFSDDCYQKMEDLEFDQVNGGNTLVVEDDNGDIYTVTPSGEIVVQKAQTTANSAALIPESVEGNEKKLTPKENIEKAIVTLVEAHKEGLIDRNIVKKAVRFKKFIERVN